MHSPEDAVDGPDWPSKPKKESSNDQDRVHVRGGRGQQPAGGDGHPERAEEERLRRTPLPVRTGGCADRHRYGQVRGYDRHHAGLRQFNREGRPAGGVHQEPVQRN